MFNWLSPRTLPLIVAHRGSSKFAPENTLAAFRRAIDDGADAVELDVRCSADGEVVVIHDASLSRTAEARGRVEQMTLAELRSLSAGSWFHRGYAAERIPTLDEVLELIKGQLGINIEIKSGRPRRGGVDVVDRCMAAVHRHGAVSGVLISSFHHRYLDHLHANVPGIAVGYLYDPLNRIGRSPVRTTKRKGGQYMILNARSVGKTIIERAHAEGLRVGAFTINTRKQLGRVVVLNIDAVYTDDPSGMRKFLNALK